MRKLQKRYILLFSTIFSLVINSSLLMTRFDFIVKTDAIGLASTSPRTIIKVRQIGRKNSNSTRDVVRLKDLSVQSINDLLSRKALMKKKQINKVEQRKSAIKNVQLISQQTQSVAGTDSELVINTGIKFESKKGTPIDELNTHELVYYGFKNRSAIQYKNAVIKNINKLKRDNPSLFRRIQNSIHDMSGRISYDREGNVMNIKVLQWSESDEIQDFFVNALKDIRAIPNPPAGILDEDGFRGTYQLKLIL